MAAVTCISMMALNLSKATCKVANCTQYPHAYFAQESCWLNVAFGQGWVCGVCLCLPEKGRKKSPSLHPLALPREAASCPAAPLTPQSASSGAAQCSRRSMQRWHLQQHTKKQLSLWSRRYCSCGKSRRKQRRFGRWMAVQVQDLPADSGDANFREFSATRSSSYTVEQHQVITVELFRGICKAVRADANPAAQRHCSLHPHLTKATTCGHQAANLRQHSVIMVQGHVCRTSSSQWQTTLGHLPKLL